jgi:hypothetical protein
MMLNEYPQEFFDSIMKPIRNDRPSSDKINQGTDSISGPFSTLNIHSVGHWWKRGPVRDAQRTKHFVCIIPFDYSKCYFGETSRLLDVLIKKHRYNLSHCLLEKSKLAQHAYEEGHKICWNEAKVLQVKPNTTYRKYKESAHMYLIDQAISQPSSDISRYQSRT